MQMRVLMTTGLYAMGGASVVIENLADQLSKKGVETTIAALAFRRIPPNRGYGVRKLPLQNISKLKRLLNDFDIVHNHHPIINYMALICRSPFIYHYHGAPNLGLGYLFRFSVLLSVKTMNHAFDTVIAVSESGSDELKRCFGLNGVNVVYNGVDTGLFKPGLDESFRKGAPQFLFVGTLYGYKKVEELMLALRKVVKAYPEAYLQIVGGGHAHGRLKRFVVELELQDNVELVGRVPHCELPYYYGSCDVYVTASRCELFGLPLLEAMACGKPIVASSIPSHVELLTRSKAGVTYAVGNIEDLSERMIRTYEERDRYESNCLHFAKEHEWSVVADRMREIYRQTLRIR